MCRHPVRDDFFRGVIEQRKALPNLKDVEPEDKKRLDRFLKILANAGTYGNSAQLNRLDLPEKELVTVYGLNGHFSASTQAVETPGHFYFPPLAALITSGARLMQVDVQVTPSKGAANLPEGLAIRRAANDEREPIASSNRNRASRPSAATKKKATPMSRYALGSFGG